MTNQRDAHPNTDLVPATGGQPNSGPAGLSHLLRGWRLAMLGAAVVLSSFASAAGTLAQPSPICPPECPPFLPTSTLSTFNFQPLQVNFCSITENAQSAAYRQIWGGPAGDGWRLNVTKVYNHPTLGNLDVSAELYPNGTVIQSNPPGVKIVTHGPADGTSANLCNFYAPFQVIFSTTDTIEHNGETYNEIDSSSDIWIEAGSNTQIKNLECQLLHQPCQETYFFYSVGDGATFNGAGFWRQ